MKRILAFAVMAQSILCLPGNAQEKNKDLMIKKIFTVIQQKNEKEFIDLFPDAVTLKGFVEKVFAGEEKERLDTILAELTDSSLRLKFRDMFAEIMKRGNDLGIDWAKANFISYQLSPAPDQEQKMDKLAGKIYFTAAGKEYFMAFNEIIWFDQLGWYGVDIGRIGEKSKENE